MLHNTAHTCIETLDCIWVYSRLRIYLRKWYCVQQLRFGFSYFFVSFLPSIDLCKLDAMDGDSQDASERILLEPYKYLLQLPGECFPCADRWTRWRHTDMQLKGHQKPPVLLMSPRDTVGLLTCCQSRWIISLAKGPKWWMRWKLWCAHSRHNWGKIKIKKIKKAFTWHSPKTVWHKRGCLAQFHL